MTCERCGYEATAFTGSWFNLDVICMACADQESKHPLYQQARAEENAAVARGDYNWPGIGLPEDLKPKEKEVT